MERVDIRRIRGLSEKRQLPRLGKIRLGVKVRHLQSGKEYPKEVPYFVCPPEVQKVYGEKPTEIDIMFPTENELECFPQALKWYGSTQGLKCKGDGEIALRRWEDCTEEQKEEIGNGEREPNDLVEISCPCEKLGKECSASGNLMVMLPKVSVGGVYQIDTGSGSNIININSYIDYLRAITATPSNPKGRISLIPLKLRRIEREMTYFDEKNVAHKSKHYLLQLEMSLTIDDIERLRRDRIAIPGAKYQIAPPVEDGKDYPEVVEIVEDEEKPQIAPTGQKNDKGNGNVLPEGKKPSREQNQAQNGDEKEKVKTTNYKFLEEMKKLKEIVGEGIYYEVLEKAGYKKANEIIKREDQEKIYRQLKDISEKRQAKEKTFQEELDEEGEKMERERKERADIINQIEAIKKELKMKEEDYQNILTNILKIEDWQMDICQLEKLQEVLEYFKMLKEERKNEQTI